MTFALLLLPLALLCLVRACNARGAWFSEEAGTEASPGPYHLGVNLGERLDHTGVDHGALELGDPENHEELSRRSLSGGNEDAATHR